MICVRDVIRDQLQLEDDRRRMMQRHKGQRFALRLSDVGYGYE